MIGHAGAVAAFMEAFGEGRPHHAWLLAGQKGLGKARFAEAAAIWLLAGAPAGPDFAVPDDCEAARLMAAGSHLDFRRLERTLAKTGKLRSEIVIGQVVRRQESEGQPLREFLTGTPMLGQRRVVIVDAADDMNRNTANALLKNLEEPSDDTVFLLVSHTPGRLLPTIRSRCRTLRFSRLSDHDVEQVLAGADLEGEDIGLLVAMAGGCPGRALALAAAGITALEYDLAGLAGQPVERAGPAALALARSVAGKGGEGRYAALLDRAPAVIAQRAQRLAGAARADAIATWEAASRLAREAVPMQLDPAQVAYALGMHLAAVPA
ncbi:DNA polymerase III subunit delta' [Sandarakinorhabdus sp.]|uniref:DNA polymerase III subunit delta' n=1 Tax=Sandarakinorhabdus sp. TaxID=1916663 RepID=UPI00333EF215